MFYSSHAPIWVSFSVCNALLSSLCQFCLLFALVYHWKGLIWGFMMDDNVQEEILVNWLINIVVLIL